MPRRLPHSGWVPPLYHDKRNQRGRVRFPGGRDFGCGRWPAHLKDPPPDVLQKYRQLIAEWIAHQETAPPRVAAGVTVSELAQAFTAWAMMHYRTRSGKHDSEWFCFKSLIPYLLDLYADLPIREFGPVQLRALQHHFTKVTWKNKLTKRSGRWSRKHINEQINRVRRMFHWGVGHSLVPPSVAEALAAKYVAPLRKRKTAVPEAPPRSIPSRETVWATLPFLFPPLPVMVQVHWLIGCRANQITPMRPCEIDQAADPDGRCWRYVPSVDKMEAREEGPDEVSYWIGPAAQALLQPLLAQTGPEEYVFPVNPKGRRFRAGESRGCYRIDSYNTAVQRAIKRARAAGVAVPHWSVGAIRHGRASEVRLVENQAGHQGRESAAAVLNHEESETTIRYARREAIARRVQAGIG